MASVFFRSLFNREPAMMIATMIGVGSLTMPFIIVPIRRSMGLPTYQWDGPSDPDQHPFLFQYKDAYKTQKFDDAVLLARWAQHDDYKFHDKLTPKSYEERDFPEARERLKGRSW